MTAQPIELPHPEAPVSTASAVDRTFLQSLPTLDPPPDPESDPETRPKPLPGWVQGVQFTSRGCQPWQVIPDCYVPEASTDILGPRDFETTDNVVIEPFAVAAIEGCLANQLNDRMRVRVRERVRTAVVAKLPSALGQAIETQLAANMTGGLGATSSPAMAFARLLARPDAEEIRIFAANAAAVPILLERDLITPTSGGRGYTGPLGIPFLPLTDTNTILAGGTADDVPNGEVTLWAAPGIWADWLDPATQIDFLADTSGRVEAPLSDSVGGAFVSGGNLRGNQHVETGRLRTIVVVPDCNVYGQRLCIDDTPECS